jgi:NAD(P)-dependent dehydrogenase (short-subunit alcohol dehydrogenase family)
MEADLFRNRTAIVTGGARGIGLARAEQHIQYMLSKIPMNRFGEVDDVAEMVVWLASDLCTFAAGATFDRSGGRATY